jgi:hypothetical protein
MNRRRSSIVETISSAFPSSIWAHDPTPGGPNEEKTEQLRPSQNIPRAYPFHFQRPLLDEKHDHGVSVVSSPSPNTDFPSSNTDPPFPDKDSPSQTTSATASPREQRESNDLAALPLYPGRLINSMYNQLYTNISMDAPCANLVCIAILTTAFHMISRDEMQCPYCQTRRFHPSINVDPAEDTITAGEVYVAVAGLVILPARRNGQDVMEYSIELDVTYHSIRPHVLLS